MSRIKSGFSNNTQKTLDAAESTAKIVLDVKSKVFLGNINVSLLDIQSIIPDLNNPRHLLITKEDILSGLNLSDPNYEAIKKNVIDPKKNIEIEQIERLAKSIKQNGLLNAIVVYKEGSHFYIITGERRYLSCLFLGYESIPAKILHKKPNELQLRIIQWAENCDRQDLTAWDRLENVRKIVQLFICDNNSLSARKLAEMINIGKSQAAKYLQLLKEPIEGKLLRGIKDNKIPSIKIAEFLSSIQDLDIKDLLIEDALNGMSLRQLEKKLDSLQRSIESTKKSNSTKLRWGSPKKIGAAGFIIKNLLCHDVLAEHKPLFENINWNDPLEINSAWQKLINLIDNQISGDFQ